MAGAANPKALAFIGKGVCFDTGGISIKPSAGMEDMKGDMGGAAAVTGLMHALATRKAKANESRRVIIKTCPMARRNVRHCYVNVRADD